MHREGLHLENIHRKAEPIWTENSLFYSHTSLLICFFCFTCSVELDTEKRQNPGRMECNIIHFTVWAIEEGTVWSPHRRKNLYMEHSRWEARQIALLWGKINYFTQICPHLSANYDEIGYFLVFPFYHL